MGFTSGFKPAPEVKVLYPVGAGLDVSTGGFIFNPITGQYHLNGGWNKIMGVAGRGNTFKSTIARHGTTTMAGRYISTGIIIYDTEDSVQAQRVIEWCKKHPRLEAMDLVDEGFLIIIDTSTIGNKFFAQLKEASKEKVVEFAKKKLTTQHVNEKGDPIVVFPPTIAEIDSLSKMPIEVVESLFDKNEIGDSGANVYAMREMGAKTQLMNQLPPITTQSDIYITLVGHMTDDLGALDKYAPSTKKLGFIKNGLKFTGVPNGYSFLTNTLFLTEKAAPITNAGDKGPEYPRTSKERNPTTDLMRIDVKVARCKTMSSGHIITVVTSQAEGVLPTLTELDTLRVEHKMWGLGGSAQAFYAEFLPDVKMSRTTAREKTDADPKLRRAINLTLEMLQVQLYHYSKFADIFCTPKELYDDLIAKGYDWDRLLDTRGYPVPKEQEPLEKQKEISTIDFLRMRAGLYHPAWYGELKAK